MYLSQVILDKVNIEDVIRLYRPNYRPGSLVECCFADHDDSTASMKTYPETNTCFCFGCNRGANPITLVSKADGITANEALFKLKQLFNISEEFTEISLKAATDKHSSEFDKTLDYYFRLFSKNHLILSLDQYSELADLYISRDLKDLIAFKERLFKQA